MYAQLDHMFESCAAEAACRAAFPNLRADFQGLVRRLDAGDLPRELSAATATGRLQSLAQRRLPKGYHQPVSSSTPTLFVTGDLDGGTPLWFTDRVAKGFSNQVTIVAHGQGHTEWNECVARKYAQLVRSGSVRGLRLSRAFRRLNSCFGGAYAGLRMGAALYHPFLRVPRARGLKSSLPRRPYMPHRA
jgi:TAP-like protein